MSHVTYTSHITHIDESCHPYESYHTYRWVMSTWARTLMINFLICVWVYYSFACGITHLCVNSHTNESDSFVCGCIIIVLTRKDNHTQMSHATRTSQAKQIHESCCRWVRINSPIEASIRKWVMSHARVMSRIRVVAYPSEEIDDKLKHKS